VNTASTLTDEAKSSHRPLDAEFKVLYVEQNRILIKLKTASFYDAQRPFHSSEPPFSINCAVDELMNWSERRHFRIRHVPCQVSLLCACSVSFLVARLHQRREP
jgi:hypothetical protein